MDYRLHITFESICDLYFGRNRTNNAELFFRLVLLWLQYFRFDGDWLVSNYHRLGIFCCSGVFVAATVVVVDLLLLGRYE